MHRAALAALAAASVALVAPLAGCHRSGGLEVSIQLYLECQPGPLDIATLRIDVANCGPTPGDASCGVTAPSELLTGEVGQVVNLEATDLSPMRPLDVFLENVDGQAQTWVRVFATARSTADEDVASGWLDVFVDQAGILRPMSPLVLYPEACGYPAGPDYDGDGFPTAEDCNEFDPYVNPGTWEDCQNGVDDDCDGLSDFMDGQCYDADGDGVCAFGLDQIAPGGVLPTGVRMACTDRFDDCDDTDPSVANHCACDLDGDGYCVDAFFCPHANAWGLSIVCAPGGDCCDVADQGCGAVYPGAPEACDGVDTNCDGWLDFGAEGMAGCIAEDPGLVGACGAGVYCPGVVDPVTNPAALCHDFGADPAVAAPPDGACAPVTTACSNGAGTMLVLVCSGWSPDIYLNVAFNVSTGATCTRSVLDPTYPLDVTMTSPAMATGSACNAVALTVDTSGVPFEPWTYSFYVMSSITDGVGGTTTQVFQVDVQVDDAVCGMGPGIFVCSDAAG
jgi:hypothetical protein